MKKVLVGLFLFSSLSVDASSSFQSCCEIGGAVLIGVVGANLYQAVVEEKPEDTLLIGTESYSMRSSCSSSTIPTQYDDYKRYKAGVGLGNSFIGYKYIGCKTAGVPQYRTTIDIGGIKDSDKPISRNDWCALGAGAVTGIATYAFIKYLDKK